VISYDYHSGGGQATQKADAVTCGLRMHALADADPQKIQDTTGSLLAVTIKYTNYTIILMMPHVTQHFTIQVGTMSIGKHSDTN